MQATEQAPVVLFVILFNVVLAFEFVTENVQSEHTATVGGTGSVHGTIFLEIDFVTFE